MRVRDHMVLAAAGAAVLRPLVGRGIVPLCAASVLIDVDHYAWFCVRQRRLSPMAAVRAFTAADPEQHSATRLLHSPPALLAALLVGIRRRRLLPVAAGMSAHVALDEFHRARMGQARAAALERDGFRCRACGAGGPDVDGHVWRQPWLLPSYRPQNLVALCGPCHQAAHAPGAGRGTWT